MAKDYGKGRGRDNRIAKAERKAAWNQAIREGRMVRFNNGECLRSYNTPEAAQAIVAAAKEDGLDAEIVDPSLAQ